MSEVWKEVDKRVDLEAIRRGMKEAEEQEAEETVSYEDVPCDRYEVAVEKMDMKFSKSSHKPMLSIWMRIREGKYKNNMIFLNQVLDEGWQFNNMKKFLKDLTVEVDEEFDFEFENYDTYSDMILDVMEAIDGNFEYLVDYHTVGTKGFKVADIKEVYVLE